jgi:replicative DNA helicase
VSDFKQWALYYRSIGMHPIPVEVRGKRPILASWSEYFTRQPTVDEIERWWTETPEANIGLIQGRGAFVLDVDGDAGAEALKLAGVNLPILGAPSVITGKGAHYYMRGAAPNSVAVLPQVDVRSDGGYVVAPPSVHATGRVYSWASPLIGGPESFPEAAANLIEVLNRPKGPIPTGARVEGWLLDALDGVGEGQRDIMCARLAGHFWGRGEAQEVVERIMQLWAETCTPPFPPEEVTKTVNSICKREGGPQQAPSHFPDVLTKTLAQIFEPQETRPTLARTSIPGLDKLLSGGFYPGNYILLAARPSVGKSALAVQVARTQALRGTGVLVCTAEMTETEVAQWMLAQHTNIPQDVLLAGVAPTDTLTAKTLRAGAEELSKLPLWITSEVQTAEALHETLAQFEPGALGLVIVDYLQNLTAPGKEQGRHTIEHLSRMMKRAAVKFNVPVLVLSALVRPPRDADGWRPHLADLRESGKLEHDADIVLMMHREIENADGTLYVRKFRGGKAGTQLNLHFEGRYLTFTEAS